jgi:hypothetical protein
MQKLLCVILLTLTAGCAEVQITHVSDKDADNDSDIHFYEPRPYLLISAAVKPDAAGKSQPDVTTQIIWLPDHTRRYKVKIKPGWGTVDGSVKLVNGWMLDSLGSKMDSKIPETITAVSGLIKESAALSALSGDAQKDSQKAGLYRIDIADDGLVTFKKTGDLP